MFAENTLHPGPAGAIEYAGLNLVFLRAFQKAPAPAPAPARPRPGMHLTVWNEREFETACSRVRFYRVSFTPGLPVSVHPAMCKARRCEDCGWFWSWKWRYALSEKTRMLEAEGLPRISRAVTLTTAYNAGPEKLQRALEYFWRLLRRYSPDHTRHWKKGRRKLNQKAKKAGRTRGLTPYQRLQYWGVVEANQAQTQPHLHFVIYNPLDDANRGYIKKEIIQRAWEEAQKQAGFEKIAWDTRIERIKSNVTAYFTKYITKLTGGKNEVPGDWWKGRYVRYSQDFFGHISCESMIASLNLAKYLSDPLPGRSYSLIAENVTVEQFIEIARRENDLLNDIVNQDWDFYADKDRAVVFEPEMFPNPPPEKVPKLNLLREKIKRSIEYWDYMTPLCCPITGRI